MSYTGASDGSWHQIYSIRTFKFTSNHPGRVLPVRKKKRRHMNTQLSTKTEFPQAWFILKQAYYV